MNRFKEVTGPQFLGFYAVVAGVPKWITFRSMDEKQGRANCLVPLDRMQTDKVVERWRSADDDLDVREAATEALRRSKEVVQNA